MKLADRSPGSILAIGAAILCTQILFEIGIWNVAPSLMPLAVAFCMVTAVAFAVFILWWLNGLLSDGAPSHDEVAPAAAPKAVQAEVKRPAIASRVPLSPSMSARA